MMSTDNFLKNKQMVIEHFCFGFYVILLVLPAVSFKKRIFAFINIKILILAKNSLLMYICATRFLLEKNQFSVQSALVVLVLKLWSRVLQ